MVEEIKKRRQMENMTERIRDAVAAIEQRDLALAAELMSVRERERGSVTEMAAAGPGADVSVPENVSTFELETIVLRTGRPVLAVSNNEPRLVFDEIESDVWKDRLIRARDGIIHAVRAVGRIELENNPRFQWVGTGWLVDEDIIVTNRHVASEFAKGDGQHFTFRSSPLGTMSALIDFLQEVDSTARDTFDLQEILHIESDKGPDIAFLRVRAQDGEKLATPISLSQRPLTADEKVAVIGYPARDSRVPEIDLMDRIFGNVYNKKRLAPGQLIAFGSSEIEHDCSTLGGSSGSVVLSLESGEAVGLHFSGQFLKANYAVPATLIASRLIEIKRRGSSTISTSAARSPSTTDCMGVEQSGLLVSQQVGDVTFQLPLTISVRLGTSSLPAAIPSTVTASVPIAQGIDSDEIFTEGRVEDYSEREGYQRNFLGRTNEIPLPEIRATNDIIIFPDGENPGYVLRYQHFSVIMSASRRMCFLSAVNINGKQSHRSKRGPWKIDPRIPKEAQIMKECYGNAPKFSRGHMTRREDPVWGNEPEAARGNADSMHLTNVVPQMQPFNAGIWLGLEDYALQNSREDDMSISVFTGPLFSNNDPIMYGVKIPTSFWKVIAFIHDDTGELCATGYMMSQKAFLQRQEFVFGQHETSQKPISAIEQQAGLDFGPLSSLDPLRRSCGESVFTKLADFSQILFL
jgi:endonuclease G, mitochondrial